MMNWIVAWIASMSTIQWVVTFLLSLIALFSAVYGCFKRAQDRRVNRMKEQNMILAELVSINKRLDNMDKERNLAREDDAYIRTRSYIGQVAILDAIMRLASHQGLEINGEIAEYRRENIDCLKNGKGTR